MSDQPGDRPAIRVLNSQGNTVGVAAPVGPREILTCAHVVNAALGRDLDQEQAPSDEDTVELAFGDGPRLRARVERWLPPPRPGAVGDDIAGLVLTSAELPTGTTPVQLAVDLRTQGRRVRVFGYPHTRSHGVWATATIAGRTDNRDLQLDCTPDTVRIQPGFSGSPVYDDATGLVVGLLAKAPEAASEDRDSSAIPADRLRLAWPEVLDPGHTQSPGRVSELTILHVSGLQFGRDPLVGGNGLTLADQAQDAPFRRLRDDLAALSEHHGLRPDLMVVTGDLTKRGLGSEFDQAVEFLTALTEAVRLPRRRVAIVPGNHDVNRKACEAHFIDHEADEREPVVPYWPKWKHFADAFNQFYQGIDEVSFTRDEPWTLFEMPDLAVVVAGLNSTIAESHRDADHYGWVGEQQLGWFADRLAGYREQGWLRLAAVHHNAVLGAVAEENLRDADDLGRRLGQSGLVNLLLHGHAHDGRLHRLPSGLLALSTGSAAVTAEARPPEVPNQYQLLTVRPNAVTRHARRYSLGERRWIDDTRISATGSDWRQHHELVPPLRHVHGTFASHAPHDPPIPPTPGPAPVDVFFAKVLEVTQASHDGATVTSRPEYGYLRVTKPLPDGGGAPQWMVGVVDGEVTDTALQSFVARVHADPSSQSELVYSGPPAAESMERHALRQGVRLRSFVAYQGLVDLRPLVQSQANRLTADLIYPTRLYVPQRYQLLDNGPDSEVCDDLLGQVIDWLGTDDARFVMVLGDFGRGKTFLLRELARTLQRHLPNLPPVLLELRNLEKKNTLEELLTQHLLKQGVNTVDRTKLRFMINNGLLVLLCDGYDELESRIGYDNAADYLKILLGAVTKKAKVVLTSRNQHFRSNAQISAAMGAQVNIIASQVVELKDFTDDQIMQFLTRHYGGDSAAAQARFALLRDVLDLRGLSRNPRMLSFIADLDEQRLRDVQAEHGQISAAELYRELVEFWLLREVDRDSNRGGLPALDDKERLAACTTLALRLWATADRTIPLTEFTTKVSQTLTKLAEHKFTSEQAAHTVGVGTLLVRTPEGEFTFVHESVMEWLVANSAAESLTSEKRADTLLTRTMSALMIDFLCDLAGHEVTHRWAQAVLADSATSTEMRENASAVTQRLGPAPYLVLVGVDLRGKDVTRWDFQNANMQGANLRDMWLSGANFAGADLRGAQLTGVRMIGGDLTGARLSGSLWHRAALLGVSCLDNVTAAPELVVAAIAGRDPAEVMIAPTGDVSSVAFSPDGSLLALSRGSCVEIVEVASRHPLRVLSGHTGEVTGVAFSPDGTVLATTSTDHTTRLWNPTTGQHRTTLTGHTDQVTSVAFSPDGTLLATTSTDHTTRLWNPTTGQHRTTLTGHTDQVTSVAFSPDGTLLATTSTDHTTRLWNPTTGQHRTTLTGHTDQVTSVAFSPDGTLLATTSTDRTTRLWNPTTGQHRTTLTGHTDQVTSVAFSPDGTLLATTSTDRTTQLWDPATGHHHTTLTMKGALAPGATVSPGLVRGMAFSPDGTLLATASADGTARLWDPATGQHHTTLQGHTNRMRAVAFSPDGTILATTFNDGTAWLWDTATGQHHTTLQGHTDWVRGVAFSPDGRLVATASDDRTARLWDTASGQHRTTLQGHTERVTGVAFSPDGTLLATVSTDGTTRLWNTAIGQYHTRLIGYSQGVPLAHGATAHPSPMWGVAFSPDGKLLATASDDGTVSLWRDPRSRRRSFGRERRSILRGHTGWVRGVAFSPDSTLLATASDDGTARLWNPTTRQHHTTLTGHTGWVTVVAFSPDGKLLATASDDGTTRLWNPTTGQHHTTLTGHTGWVRGVAFSPDGTLLATTSTDGTARLWDPATGAARATLFALEAGGYGVLLPDGSYKLEGDPGLSLWWAIKLCRFAPGDLDPHVPAIRRLPADAPLSR